MGIDGFNDSNGDGFDDNLFNNPRGAIDTDNDGIIDSFDLDSDNDGIPDTIENSLPDSNFDGIIDGFTDNNQDGVDDNISRDIIDTDGDFIPNYIDLDSDNDGVPDILETNLQDNNGDGMVDNFIDSLNRNGWNDSIENSNMIIDTDGDLVPDYLDLDSDNDGMTDLFESGQLDTARTGIVSPFFDSTDNGWNDNSEQSLSSLPDTDGDSIPDLRDLDSDNDSIPDVEEAGYTDANGDAIIDNFTDLNGNGRDDTVESLNYGPLDFDNDGIYNYQDLDSDNDAVADLLEGNKGHDMSIVDPDNNGCIDFEDLDGDGIPDIIDSFVGFGTSSWQQVSSAYVNLDSDSDGIIDIVDLQIPIFGGILTLFDPNQSPSSVTPSPSPNSNPSNNAQPSSGSGVSITPGPVPTSNSPVPLSASATPSRMPNAAGPVPAGASTPTRTPDASTQIVGSTPDSAEIVVNVICSDTTCTPQEIDDFLDNFDTIFVPGETGVLLMNGNQLTLSVCGSERIQEQVLTLQETVSSIQIERVTYGIDCSDINYYYGFYDFYESSLSTMVIPSFITMLMSLFLLL